MTDAHQGERPWQVLRQHRRTLLLIAGIGALIGITGYLLRTKHYKAEVDFFLKNPMYADRSYLYNTDARMIDYFATPEDVDRLRSLAWSDTVQDQIVREFGLMGAYDVDSTSAAGRKAVKKAFSTRISVLRSADNVVQLWYSDKDEDRAAAVAERTVQLLEGALRGYYNEMRHSIYETLAAKLRDDDSLVEVLTDSLAALRTRYGIYDIVSPSRHNIMLSGIKAGNTPGFARGLEEVQNIESIKDELVTMRSRHVTLVSQYATGTRVNDLPLTRILKVEKPPLKSDGPGLLLTTAACALIAAFCSVVYFLMMAYSRGVNR